MFKIVDIAVLFPSSAVAFTQIFKWMGGQISIPILDNIPVPLYSILIAAMTFYWVARGISIMGKTYGDFVEKQHMNELHKIRNNRERRDEYVRKSAIYATRDQIAKLNELETKQLKEREAFLAKMGIKGDAVLKPNVEDDEV